MNAPKSTLRLVVSNAPSTKREEERRGEAIVRRLVLAADDEDFNAAFREFIRWAGEPDLTVVR